MAKKDTDNSWISSLGVIAIIGFLALLAHSTRKEADELKREEKRRKSIPCQFDNGISEMEFQVFVKQIGRKIRRVTQLSIEGPIVYGEVISQSGLTKWNFEIDFNDYGHVTGKYWIFTENNDSNIPTYISDCVKEFIEGVGMYEEADYDFDEPVDSENDIKIKYSNFREKAHRDSYIKKENVKRNSIVILAVCMIVFVLGSYFELRRLIPMEYSSKTLVGLEYTQVVQNLHKAGFTNIHKQKISDLPIECEEKENLVTKVKLEYGDKFDKHTKYPVDSKIIVVYHTVSVYSAPLSSKEAKGMNYQDVIRKFKKAGFTNISTSIKYDVITGWLTDNGEVKSVTVNGEKIDLSDKFRPDAKIVVTYHALRKNKPR